MSGRVCVIGEALIDVVRTPDGVEAEHVGGSPLNVAAGLARLGHDVDFATTVGADDRGERIGAHLADHGVHLTAASRTADPTSTAVADLDESGAASYTFDLHWDLAPVLLDESTGHVHTGSIGAMLAPGDARVLDAVVAGRAVGTVSYDPNIRPTVMGSGDGLRARVEQVIAASDVVKASSDDLDLLYPGMSATEVLARWSSLGVALSVVTLGADGVVHRVLGDEGVGTLPTRALRVVDTVGAGDSFMAGLLSGLLDAGLLGRDGARGRLASATLDEVAPAVHRALGCAAVTVAHAGAYAPTPDELS